jgi:biotin carboxyl carrier protein
MKKFNFTISGNKYNVNILNYENNIVELEVNGTKYEVEVENQMKVSKTPTLVRSNVPAPTTKEKKIPKKLSGVSGGSEVKSPLPGSIFKITVSEGDTVKAGDRLLIMEAMKMENNILAEKDGVVQKINVKVGDPVLQNDVLMILE